MSKSFDFYGIAHFLPELENCTDYDLQRAGILNPHLHPFLFVFTTSYSHPDINPPILQHPSKGSLFAIKPHSTLLKNAYKFTFKDKKHLHISQNLHLTHFEEDDQSALILTPHLAAKVALYLQNPSIRPSKIPPIRPSRSLEEKSPYYTEPLNHLFNLTQAMLHTSTAATFAQIPYQSKVATAMLYRNSTDKDIPTILNPTFDIHPIYQLPLGDSNSRNRHKHLQPPDFLNLKAAEMTVLYSSMTRPAEYCAIQPPLPIPPSNYHTSKSCTCPHEVTTSKKSGKCHPALVKSLVKAYIAAPESSHTRQKILINLSSVLSINAGKVCDFCTQSVIASGIISRPLKDALTRHQRARDKSKSRLEPSNFTGMVGGHFHNKSYATYVHGFFNDYSATSLPVMVDSVSQLPVTRAHSNVSTFHSALHFLQNTTQKTLPQVYQQLGTIVPHLRTQLFKQRTCYPDVAYALLINPSRARLNRSALFLQQMKNYGLSFLLDERKYELRAVSDVRVANLVDKFIEKQVHSAIKTTSNTNLNSKFINLLDFLKTNSSAPSGKARKVRSAKLRSPIYTDPSGFSPKNPLYDSKKIFYHLPTHIIRALAEKGRTFLPSAHRRRNVISLNFRQAEHTKRDVRQVNNERLRNQPVHPHHLVDFLMTSLQPTKEVIPPIDMQARSTRRCLLQEKYSAHASHQILHTLPVETFVYVRNDVCYKSVTRKLPTIMGSKSYIAGGGLFAAENIPPNTVVIEYIGPLIPRGEAPIREKMYIDKGMKSTYFFNMGEEEALPLPSKWMTIDATLQGNAARWINHSCDPSCEAQSVVDSNGGWHVLITTIRFVRAGEELTYNYKLDVRGGMIAATQLFEEEDYYDSAASRQEQCWCGSVKCQSTVDKTIST